MNLKKPNLRESVTQPMREKNMKKMTVSGTLMYRKPLNPAWTESAVDLTQSCASELRMTVFRVGTAVRVYCLHAPG